jgi:hypothetical protein
MPAVAAKVKTIVFLMAVFSLNCFAIDGFAVSTHWVGASDGGMGINFGNIVRHDVKKNVLSKDTVLYAGMARCAVINQTGDLVAFIVQSDGIWVIGADGSDLQKLKNSRNGNGSWMDWPQGDWIYYTEEGMTPSGSGDPATWDTTGKSSRLRRVNVLTGADEAVAMFGGKIRIWEFGLEVHAQPNSGHFVCTATDSLDAQTAYVRQFDLSKPLVMINDRLRGCGSSISPSGKFFTLNQLDHVSVQILDWNRLVKKLFTINQWVDSSASDKRTSWNRHRWSANSDRWVTLTQGMNYPTTVSTNQVLYDWVGEKQVQVTQNRVDVAGCDEGEDFWLSRSNLSASGLTFYANLGQTAVAFQHVKIGTADGFDSLRKITAVSDQSWLSTTVVDSGNQKNVINSVNISGLSTGIYKARVTVKTLDTVAGAYWVRLYLYEKQVSKITIFPRQVIMRARGSALFSEAAIDQYGQPVTASVTWKCNGGGIMSQSGIFTSDGSEGSFSIVVSASSGSDTAYDSASVRVRLVPYDSLRIWLRADTGVISPTAKHGMFWIDVSKISGDTATCPVTHQPSIIFDKTNNLPTVQFDGNAYLDIKPIVLGNFTVFMVFKSEKAPDMLSWVVSGSADTVRGFSCAGNSAIGSDFPNFCAWSGDRGLMEKYAVVNGGFRCISIQNNKLFECGQELETSSTLGKFVSGALQSMVLSRIGARAGAHADTAFDALFGCVSEIAVYSTVLPDSLRQAVELYLTEKYGVRPAQKNADSAIAVTSRLAGASFHIGDTLPIQWKSDSVWSSQVKIEVSLDNGKSWHFVNTESAIYRSDPQWGNYLWPIPDSIDGTSSPAIYAVSAQCKVRVSDYFRDYLVGVSDGVFAITPRPVSTAMKHATATLQILIKQNAVGRLDISIPDQGLHSVEVFRINGQGVFSRIGFGACHYEIPRDQISSGLYLVRIATPFHNVMKKMLIK